MTVRDLRELLEEMNPDAKVRFAFQPRYPLEYNVKNEIVQSKDEKTVYIADGGQIGYLNSEAIELLEWDF